MHAFTHTKHIFTHTHTQYAHTRMHAYMRQTERQTYRMTEIKEITLSDITQRHRMTEQMAEIKNDDKRERERERE